MSFLLTLKIFPSHLFLFLLLTLKSKCLLGLQLLESNYRQEILLPFLSKEYNAIINYHIMSAYLFHLLVPGIMFYFADFDSHSVFDLPLVSKS